MDSDDPITQWLADLQSDERAAAEKLWQRYWRRVAGMARKVLGARAGGGADEDDVAQSVFRTFFLRAQDGQFPQLEDRQDLWNLLVTITIRKAIKTKRRQLRQAPAVDNLHLIGEELSEPPGPDVAIILQDEINRLVGMLDETSQKVTGLLMEGYSNKDAADACGVSIATIERKRKLIRETWRRELVK